MNGVRSNIDGTKSFLCWSIGPVIVFLVIAFLGPFLYMLWLSLTDLSFSVPEQNGNFIGLLNYSRALFNDPIFISSIGRSGLFTLLCVIPEIIIGIVVAEFLYKHPITKRILSPLFALPVLLPSVVIGLYWRLLLQGEFGLLSHYVSKLGLGSAKNILSNPDTILFTMAGIDLWQWGPFVVLIFLAIRSSLPSNPLEAARIDGASPLRAFFDVTLPSLLPTVFIVSLVRAIDSFKEFDKVFILTGGGPGTASELSSIYVWRMAFKQWNFGYAATLCILVYLIIFIVTQGGLGAMKSRLS